MSRCLRTCSISLEIALEVQSRDGVDASDCAAWAGCKQAINPYSSTLYAARSRCSCQNGVQTKAQKIFLQAQSPIFQAGVGGALENPTMSKYTFFLAVAIPLRGHRHQRHEVVTPPGVPSALHRAHAYVCVSFCAVPDTGGHPHRHCLCDLVRGGHCPDLTGWLDRFQQTLDAPALIGMV